MAHVLLVGSNGFLIATKSDILAGLDLDKVRSLGSGELLVCPGEEIELVVFCRSLGLEVKAALLQLVRIRWPRARVMQLTSLILPAHEAPAFTKLGSELHALLNRMNDMGHALENIVNKPPLIH